MGDINKHIDLAKSRWHEWRYQKKENADIKPVISKEREC
jgi:hypothetical protein